jgi:hypothetical protein
MKWRYVTQSPCANISKSCISYPAKNELHCFSNSLDNESVVAKILPSYILQMDQFHCIEAKCNFKPPSAKIPNSVLLMKTRWSFLFLGLLHLTSKSSWVHIAQITSELEFFLLTRVLTQNFNIGPYKISWKKIETSHSKHNGCIEDGIIQNHKQNKKSEKKVEKQDSMDKTNFFLSTLPFSPWAVSTTWLHVGAP